MSTSSPAEFARQREEMVTHQLKARGVHDQRVLAAMAEIPREVFVPEDKRSEAYQDCPLPIGGDQTISQPYIVGLMTQLLELRGNERVLEIGAGCGYQSAILSRLAAEVCALEINEELRQQASANLGKLDVTNVDLRRGNGAAPWPDGGTFDAILAACAPITTPTALIDQLAPGGRLVVPVGPSGGIQTLHRIHRLANGNLIDDQITQVRFVPMLG